MSRRFIIDTVFGQMFTTSESEKVGEEALLGNGKSGQPDRTVNEKTTEPFQYTALYGQTEEPAEPGRSPVRLLELLPGTRQDDIECRLQPTSLEAVQDQYEALSYVWGDMRETTPIQVNGATLQVGMNLRCALLNLRHETEARTLWVDAICINEDDIAERERQVAVMGRVYRGANRTIVWLGDSKPAKTAAGFHAVQILGEAAQLAKESKPDTQSVAAIKPGKDPVYQRVKTDTAVTEDLLRRPWWQRMWTAQEIVLAKRALLVCGRHQVEWDFFCDAVHHGLALNVWDSVTLGTFVTADFVYFHSIRALRELAAGGGDGSDERAAAEQLLDLVLYTRRRQAGLPADKIFGVMGLLHGTGGELGISPDYVSPPAEVYRNACAKLIEHSGTLDVLGACFPFDGQSAVQPLPSWVPDWSPTGTMAQPLLNDPSGRRRGTHATKNTVCRPRFADSGATLIVEGYSVDKISRTSSTLREVDDSAFDTDIDFPDEKGMRETLRDLAKLFGQAFEGFAAVIPHLAIYVEWERFVRDLRPTNPDPRTADPMAIYWQTLCTGVMAAPDAGGYEQTERLFWEWHRTLDPVRKLVGWKVDKAATGAFKSLGFLGYLRSTWHSYGEFMAFLTQCTERRLGGTDRGYLCLLPKAAQPGDELVLLKGGRVPVVLRTKEDGDMAFVGEAFVHGAMDGAAFDESRCRDIRIR